jgi:hypothetical protein
MPRGTFDIKTILIKTLVIMTLLITLKMRQYIQAFLRTVISKVIDKLNQLCVKSVKSGVIVSNVTRIIMSL